MIGMSGRFPGASNVAGFWENLANGVESFAQLTDDELRAALVDERLIAHPDYVKVRPVLDDIRGFDARFFGYSPREAEIADPQQRIFLECVWEALEGAGYGRADTRGRVGLFAGANFSMYMINRFAGPAGIAHMDPYEMMIGNDKDALATVIAYRLDLTGPAVSVQTFCSTSATAMHLACQSIRRGESDIALAGGVCVRVPDRVGHLHFEGGMESPDGHIRTFDAEARGGVFGDGAGVVVLKSMRQAVADRDNVLAVIRGSAMNNDGASKFSYTAPSIVGQARAVEDALRDADVSPRDISYVEAHGTATELGDPIEVAALSRAFKSAERGRTGEELDERGYCAIGSVKTNVGHLDRAATVTGMIKVVEALRHEHIPQSLHFENPNPEIDFARSPFYVAGKPVRWSRQPGRPRLAGLNGLGMGGTNVHMIVQEAPAPRNRPADPRRWHVLPLSAQVKEAGEEQRTDLARHLMTQPDTALGDVGFTLHMGRSLFSHRQVCVAGSTDGAAAALSGEKAPDATLLVRHDPARSRRVGLVFAGVGEHYTGMVAELYRTEPVFRKHLDHGRGLLAEYTSIDVVTPLTAERSAQGGGLAALMGRDSGPADDPFADTRVAQPAVFLAEYALAATLMEWGLKPAAVLGYSVGEYVAACLAGVLSLPDALRLVAHRAELIAELPAGAMLAVGLTRQELSAKVPDLEARGLDLSAVVPGQAVVAGPVDAVRELAAFLRDEEIVCRELQTTHAFHSRMLAPKADELTRWIAEHITLSAPVLPCLSNVTGGEMDADLVTDPAYWARHMCSPVRFEEGLGEMLGQDDMTLIEIGPGRSLGAMARAHEACDRSRWPLIVSTLPAASEDTGDDRTLAECLGELWLCGVDIDWDAYHRNARDFAPGRVQLPTYPFQRQEYWYESGWTPPSQVVGGLPEGAEQAGGYEELPLLPESRWMHLPVWRQRLPQPALNDQGDEWTVFTDSGEGDRIVEELRGRGPASGRRIVEVRPGDAFARDGDNYRIRPGNTQDTLELFAALSERGQLPDRVLHLWNLGDAEAEETVRRGTHTLIALARAAHEMVFGSWKLDVVTSGVHQVTGSEIIRPERATVLGPCTIIPVECPGVTLRSLDLLDGAPAPVAEVVEELRSEPGNQVVALRGGKTWTLDYEALELPAGQDLTEPATTVRPEGVYMITGGLGGIGLAMASRLVDEYRAKVVLLGRTPVPPREQWDAILSDPSASDEVRRRIAALCELSAKGAEFMVVQADVSVPAEVQRAVAAATERFGALHGVLHAAGVPGRGMMQFKSAEDVDRVLAPKVAGTLALARALKDVPLDFLALFSSVSSVTGALGQADYSAANAFLDAFASSGLLPQARIVSIGWGEWEWNGWKSGLDGYEPVLREFYEQHRDRFGIGFDAGWRHLQRALARPEPHLFVSTQDFSMMVRGSRSHTMEDIQEGARRGRGEKRHPRPELSTLYVPARTETETLIAEIWADALGMEQVGIHDNFFDLGGNSLLGVGIVAAIRRGLELDRLPAHVIYQAPTVAALAALAVPDATPEGGPESDHAAHVKDRALQRHERLARRRAGQRGGSE
ncbi:type I polyketide synthase [Streptomyces phaeofaciens]|uniref:type I polyketide synthase n=1 Tax=Streptomyces phaeofaciens TaxID=68254 RepID=UPI00227D8BD5|nr:type I polyketide synthase [Streptomyces phaeofaciens]